MIGVIAALAGADLSARRGPPVGHIDAVWPPQMLGGKVPCVFFVVRLQRGGRWDWSRDLRAQVGWNEHADFMDSLVDDGFIVLGGPLAGDREILHVISAASQRTVRERLALDNWHQNGMLTITSIEPWTILLDGRQA